MSLIQKWTMTTSLLMYIVDMRGTVAVYHGAGVAGSHSTNGVRSCGYKCDTVPWSLRNDVPWAQ